MALVAIGRVAELFGVTCQTIRNWTKEGIFEVYRTKGGHRRFSIEEVSKILEPSRMKMRKNDFLQQSDKYDKKEDCKRQT